MAFFGFIEDRENNPKYLQAVLARDNKLKKNPIYVIVVDIIVGDCR